MKDLDAINPQFARPSSIASTAAILPIFCCTAAAVLAAGAAPGVPFWKNPLSVVCAAFAIASVIFFFIPKVSNWGWEAKYFGAALLCLVSAAFGLVPWLCFMLYSRLPLILRFVLFSLYAGVIIRRCYRFVVLYRSVYGDKKMRSWIYEEQEDAVYYLQKGDAWMLEQKMKFAQFPGGVSFAVAWGLAFLMITFLPEAKEIVGLPFTHILLAVGSVPIDMAMLGLATRGWLVFYFYPARILRETGKRVYVDMANKPSRV